MKNFIIFAVLIAFSVQLFAQAPRTRKSRYGFDLQVQPPIAYAAFVSYKSAEWKPELLINIRLQNDVLAFTRNGDNYEAQYQISVAVREKETKHVFVSEAWHETVTESDFESTNAKDQFQFTARRLPLELPLGKYEIFVEISDRTTQNVYRNARDLKISTKNDSTIAHSEIIFVNDLAKEPVPADIHGNLPFNSDGFVYFEILNEKPTEYSISTKVFSKIKDSDECGALVYEQEHVEETSGPVFTFREVLPRKVLKEGRYVVRYVVNNGARETKLEKPFSVIWYDKPVFLYNWDLAIRPMRYLFSETDWEAIQNRSNDELEEWFDSYWAERDPSPDTPLNEVQQEFYQRVDRSNKIYSLRFKDGWETDMGRSLILYGDPDSVDSKIYNANKRPFEIWYYNSTNKKLIFVDKDDSKDFQLVRVEEIKEKPTNGQN